MFREGPGPGGPWRGGGPRFLVRTGEPPAYWIGLGVSMTHANPLLRRGMLLIRAPSFWSLLRVLDFLPLLAAGAVVLGLSILFWWPLVSSLTRAIKQLTTATEKIAEGRFETRVATGRRDELGKLGDSVNRMAGRLDTLVSGQKRFLGDVAHELCSPLARLQMATSILEERVDPAMQNAVTDVREEVQQMNALVNELLAFTKAGLKPRDLALTNVSIASLVQEVLAREDVVSGVVVNIASNLHARTDPELLGRALGNLVRNALRYAAAAGPVTIRGGRERQGVVIAVEDEGAGVPPEALARLGEPFYRPESARTRETGGVGLGLSIVRGAVTACGGTILFANRTPRGFSAEIRLPIS